MAGGRLRDAGRRRQGRQDLRPPWTLAVSVACGLPCLDTSRARLGVGAQPSGPGQPAGDLEAAKVG
jgi:hypothetical protein